MKVIGILRVKDEADLLLSVLDHVAGGVDEIYAYDDNSSDLTLSILEAHPRVTYIKTFDPSFTAEVQRTSHLEAEVRKRHPEYKTEEVWVALLAGDLYWLNQSPREAAEKAHAAGYDLRTACAVNFSLHHTDDWGSKDTWPEWETPLRELCRWAKVIEELPSVWKVSDYTEYKRLPWPRHFKNRAQRISKDTPFLEHQGKRSPRHFQHKVLRNLGKAVPRGTEYEQYRDLKWVDEYGKGKGYWNNPEAVPWLGLETIDVLLEIEATGDRSKIYEKWDRWYEEAGRVLPPRTDL